MKTKPILFSTLMIHANSAGVKTQTRRIVDEIHNDFLEYCFKNKKNLADWISRNAKYNFGDILWIRETFGITEYGYVFKADFCSPGYDKPVNGWKPSIHMPKEIARKFLKILSVRIERLQDISMDDSIQEGIIALSMSNAQIIESGQLYLDYSKPTKILNDGLSPKASFKSLWEKINGKDSWTKNPFVWVYEYEIIKKPENFI